MEFTIDNNKCICCGTCYNAFEDIYTSNDEGKATIKKQPNTEEEINTAMSGLEYCPTEAISIKGMEGHGCDCSSCPHGCGH